MNCCFFILVVGHMFEVLQPFIRTYIYTFIYCGICEVITYINIYLLTYLLTYLLAARASVLCQLATATTNH